MAIHLREPYLPDKEILKENNKLEIKDFVTGAIYTATVINKVPNNKWCRSLGWVDRMDKRVGKTLTFFYRRNGIFYSQEDSDNWNYCYEWLTNIRRVT